MGFNEIAFTVITGMISLIGYFLKNLHSDLKSVIKEQKELVETQSKLKGKIELVENELKYKYDSIEKMTKIEIKNLAEQIEKLTQSVNKLIDINLNK